MKYLLVICALIAALGWSQTVTAQQAPDPTPLETACKALWEIGENNGLKVRSCRRSAPDEVNWRGTTVHAVVNADLGAFKLKVITVQSPHQLVSISEE